MAYQLDLNCRTLVASTDLSTHKFKVVEMTSAGIARLAALGTGFGVLQNVPKAGEAATVAISGQSKAIAGGTVTANDHLRVLSGGWVVKANSGDLSGIIDMGICMASAASGAITVVDLNPTWVANVISGSLVQASP
jgi:hypothetical protein